jgi:uncharacterized protein (TIGR03083 family)
MDKDLVWRVIDDERNRLADLMEDLSDAEWRTPSLCTGWTVREVAAHLTLAHLGLRAAIPAAIRAGGSFNRMIRDTAIRQARLPVEEYPRRLRAMVGSRRTAPFITELEPLTDVLCHAQDIARPLGRPYPMPVDAAVVSAERVWTTSFPFWARRRLRGFELVATDAPWRAGAGVRVDGPISALLLLVSGRPAALTELSDPGAAELRRTFSRKAGPTPPGGPSTAPAGGTTSPQERHDVLRARRRRPGPCRRLRRHPCRIAATHRRARRRAHRAPVPRHRRRLPGSRGVDRSGRLRTR